MFAIWQSNNEHELSQELGEPSLLRLFAIGQSNNEMRRVESTSPSTKLDSKPVFELSKVLTKSGRSAARSHANLEVISTGVAPLATEESLDKVMKELDDLAGKLNLLAVYIIIEAASKPDSVFKQFLSAVLKLIQP